MVKQVQGRIRNDFGVEPPNGLAFSSAAPIDRVSIWADSNLQNRPDLARRKAASAATPHPTRRISVRQKLPRQSRHLLSWPYARVKTRTRTGATEPVLQPGPPSSTMS